MYKFFKDWRFLEQNGPPMPDDIPAFSVSEAKWSSGRAVNQLKWRCIFHGRGREGASSLGRRTYTDDDGWRSTPMQGERGKRKKFTELVCRSESVSPHWFMFTDFHTGDNCTWIIYYFKYEFVFKKLYEIFQSYFKLFNYNYFQFIWAKVS